MHWGNKAWRLLFLCHGMPVSLPLWTRKSLQKDWKIMQKVSMFSCNFQKFWRLCNFQGSSCKTFRGHTRAHIIFTQPPNIAQKYTPFLEAGMIFGRCRGQTRIGLSLMWPLGLPEVAWEGCDFMWFLEITEVAQEMPLSHFKNEGLIQPGTALIGHVLNRKRLLPEGKWLAMDPGEH